jgi:hypothetical protein
MQKISLPIRRAAGLKLAQLAASLQFRALFGDGWDRAPCCYREDTGYGHPVKMEKETFTKL